MEMTYQEAYEKYKSKFDEETWKKHECDRAKLKSFARLKFAGGAIYPVSEVDGISKCFIKRFRFAALSQIQSNVEAVRNLRMINEFLISSLCSQIGLESATYLALLEEGVKPNYEDIKDVKKKVNMPDSLVSKNFLKDGESLYDLDVYDHGSISGFNLKSFMDEMKYIKKGNRDLKIDFEDIKVKFLKLIVLDLLTLQLDRHDGNLPIIFNERENSLTFGPVFDSEYAFNVKALKNYDFEKDEFGLLKDGSKLDVLKVIASYNKRLEKGDDYIWTITPKCKKSYHACMRDIAVQACLSQKAKNIVLSVIENLNIGKAFDDMDKLGVEVSPAYRAFATQIVGYGKAQLVKQMTNVAQIKQQSKQDNSSKTLK